MIGRAVADRVGRGDILLGGLDRSHSKL
jgi:hypothetical protein